MDLITYALLKNQISEGSGGGASAHPIPTADDALKLLIEAGMVVPVVGDGEVIYTDEDGVIYTF